MLKTLLSRLNLQEKEIAVFLAIYKMGPAAVKTIAKETDITRTHIYDLTESLLEKGLITEFEKSGVKHYEALGHSGLIAYINQKKRQWEKTEKEFEKAASAFENLKMGTSQKTKVRFYEGVDGMIRVYEEIRKDLMNAEKCNRKVITIWPTEELEKTYPGFLENNVYLNMLGLFKRDIMTESKMTERIIKAYKNGPTKHQYKIWKKSKGTFPTDTLCWSNKVAYTNMEGGYPSGIIIESKAVADTFRIYFEEMWNNLD